jgi:hypothetical protein
MVRSDLGDRSVQNGAGLTGVTDATISNDNKGLIKKIDCIL